MRRWLLTGLLLGGCSDGGGPAAASIEGTWELQTAHGQPLPVTLQDFAEQRVVVGVLKIAPPNSSWTQCVDQGTGHGVFQLEEVGFATKSETLFELWYVTRLGFIPDTMTLSGDTLRVAYTNGAGRQGGLDQLVFTRTAADPLPDGCPDLP